MSAVVAHMHLTKIAMMPATSRNAHDNTSLYINHTLHLPHPPLLLPRPAPLPRPPALKIACSVSAPRQQVEYVIYKLGKRLNSNNWLVALKALMVFHRLMRECDPGFQEQVGVAGVVDCVCL